MTYNIDDVVNNKSSSLKWNCNNDNEDKIIHLMRTCKNFHKFQIYVSDWIHTDELCKVLSELSTNTSLRKLEIKCVTYFDMWSVVPVLTESIYVNSTLNKLFLTYLDFNDNNFTNFVNAVKKSSITELLLCGCTKYVETKLSILSLMSNTKLTVLRLVHEDLGLFSSKQVVELLETNKQLQKLNLTRNSLDDNFVTGLSAHLKHNTSLHELDLSVNSITATGATAIAEMLKSNKYLQTLNICDNDIGDYGAIELAKSLCINKSLKFLGLHSNNIRNIGGVELAKMLAVNNSLKCLKLGGYNFLDLDVLAQIAKSLCINRCLQKISLAYVYNKFTPQMKALESVETSCDIVNETISMLQTNYTLMKISIAVEKYDISDKIDEIVDRNNRLYESVTY